MRKVFFALSVMAAALAGACTVEVNNHDSGESEGGSNAAASGYTLDVVADNEVHTFMVTAPDGRVAAARAENGQSHLLDSGQIRAFAAAAVPPPEGEGQVSIRAPGFSLNVNGDEGGTGEKTGRVSINVGGHGVDVQGGEDADGDGNSDNARVHITGVDEQDARDFIAKADQISPEVQSQMLAALGLSE